MAEFRILCINKPNRESLHEHITHIGDGNTWKLSREEVIRRIDAQLEAFYVLSPDGRFKAYVGVVRENGKLPYIRTYADGKWNDNLLSLPECQDNCKLLG